VISVTLHLAAAQNVRLPTGHGHFVHAWFLDVVRRKDPRLARSLHDGRADKPFTLSLVDGGRRASGGLVVLGEGERCKLRLTALDQAASEMVERIGGGEVESLSLDGGNFRVESSTSRVRSFAELADGAACRAARRRIRFRLVSPTAFRSGRQNIAFPWPSLLISRLGARWNAYAPASLRLDGDTLATVAGAVWIGRYRLSTKMLEFPPGPDRRGHREIGCVGDCEFLVDDRAPAQVSQVARLLVDFAYYAGVGYKTTMGMGQVRPLDHA
jgi:CRISPR-associated endoribonuclease Cas6